MMNNRIKNTIKRQVGMASIKITLAIYNYCHEGLCGKFVLWLYKELLSLLNLSAYPIVSPSVYKEKVSRIDIIDIETKRVGVAGNIINVGTNEATFMKEQPLPNLQLYEFENVFIQGNSDVIVDLSNECVISEAGYNMNPNEEMVDGLLYRTRKNVCLLRNNMKHDKEFIPSGIMISGKFSHNYYHILFENLIRLVYLDRLNLPKNVPIMVDRKSLSYTSIKRIFDILTEDCGRGVVLLDDEKIYHVGKLYAFSRVNKFPSHLLTNDFRTVDYLYYAPALLQMREKLLTHMSSKVFPKRIFISRTNSASRHYNEDEVYNVLRPYGFEMVAPEMFSIEDQMSLFYGAQYIVGGSGAAFSNLLFVNSNTTAIIFTRGTYDKIIELPVFNTIANISGGRVVYFPNMIMNNENVHVNYTIDCVKFTEVIKKVFKMDVN